MRFSVQLPTDKVDRPDEFVTSSAVAEMARGVEAAGFDAGFVTDHPFPGDRWLAAGGHHSLDPFVALSFAGAATERLRLQTNVVVLPYRNPFHVAKAAASVDALSGGRLVLGVAAGYLKSEFKALGADYDARNEATDDAIRAIRAAWTSSGVAFVGRGFEARGNTMLPRPAQDPAPPIFVGGNSRRAIRRAVELGDGWIPFPTTAGAARHLGTAALEDMADLRDRIAYLRAHAAEVGRETPLEICMVPFGMDMFAKERIAPAHFLETLGELRELGVGWITITLPGDTRAEFLAEVERFGKDVIGPARSQST